MIALSFHTFTGSPRDLYDAVKKGKVAPKELPVRDLVEQALGQVHALGLAERSELLPILADLVLFKLRAFSKRPQVIVADEEEEEGGPAFLETLVALQEAIDFLTQRVHERARILPVPASPLPKDRRLRPMAVALLIRAVEPFARRAELLLEPDNFGLREAWERIKGFLWGVRRAVFGQLPFSGWYERAIAFTALLEAKKQGDVELRQDENFGALEVELAASGRREAGGERKKESV